MLGQPYGDHNCPGIIAVPYVPGNSYSAHKCPGTLLFLAPSCVHMCLDTLPVPICAQAYYCFLYVAGKPFGAHMHLGNLPVTICGRVPFRYKHVPWQPSGEHVPMDCYGAHMCPYTLLVPIIARAPFQSPYVPRHLFGADMYMGTFLGSICGGVLFRCTRALLRCSYLLGHIFSAYNCPDSISVII